MAIGNTMPQLTSHAVVVLDAKVIMQASSVICVKGDISRIVVYRINFGSTAHSLDCVLRSDGTVCEWPPTTINVAIISSGTIQFMAMILQKLVFVVLLGLCVSIRSWKRTKVTRGFW